MLVETELQLQITISFERAKLKASVPVVGPFVSSQAVEEPEPQKVFSATEAPSLLKRTSPTLRSWMMLSLSRSL